MRPQPTRRARASRAARRAPGACLAAALALPAAGAEWSIEPRVDAGLDWHDNRTLAAVSPIATWAAVTGATARGGWRTARGGIGVEPRLVLNRFSSSRLKNAEDWYLPVAMDYAFERARLSLTGDHAEELSLNSADAATGIFRADVRRATTSFAPAVTWLVDPVTTATFNGSHTRVNYDGAAGGQSDYDYSAAGVSLDRAHDELGSIGLSFRVSDFTTPDAGSRILTRGGRLSVGRTLTPRWRFEGSLGYNVSAIDLLRVLIVPDGAGRPVPVQVPDHASDSGTLYDVRVTRAFERGEASLSYGRDLAPTGNGDQQISTQLGVAGRWDWTARLASSLQYTHYERTAQAGLSGSLANTGDFVAGTLSWHLTSTLRLEGRYAWQRQSGAAPGSTSVDGHSLGLALRYAGDVRAWSR